MKNIYIFITISLVSLFPFSPHAYASSLSDTIKSIPFTENWDSQTFDTNNWSFPNSQGNWTILVNEGDSAPCAAFTGLPSKSNYAYTLQSPWFDATGLICDSIYLEFDLKLESLSNTAKEELEVILEYDSMNKTILSETNFTSFGWKSFKIILQSIHGKLFRVKFNAFGEFSVNISKWMIDNISITKKCRRPHDLYGDGELTSNGCLVSLFWNSPDCSSLELMTFEYDQGYPDWYAGTTLFQSSWGNFFPLENYYIYSGNLISFDIFFMVSSLNTDDSLFIDVYDESRILLGSTTSFLHKGWWNYIPAPSIPFTSSFYAMVRNTHGSNNNWIGVNYNNSGYNLAWYIQNGVWKKLSEAIYEDSVIFLIRATAEINGKKKNLYSGDSTLLMGYNVYRSDFPGEDFIKRNQSLILDSTYSELITGYINPTYAVTAVYDNCESGLSNFFHYGPKEPCWTGIKETSQMVPVTISPNPATTFIDISSETDIEVVRLFDVMGILRLEEKVIDKKSVQITVGNLPDGIYFISVATAKGMTTKKLVISR